jgi:hypothetical protein
MLAQLTIVGNLPTNQREISKGEEGETRQS